MGIMLHKVEATGRGREDPARRSNVAGVREANGRDAPDAGPRGSRGRMTAKLPRTQW